MKMNHAVTFVCGHWRDEAIETLPTHLSEENMRRAELPLRQAQLGTTVRLGMGHRPQPNSQLQ